MNRDTVYMHYPAAWWHDIWREGLVSGNGKVGANVYGGVKDETIMLTHHKLWHGGKKSALPDVSGAFHRLRELMDTKQFKEASWVVVNALKEQGYHAELQSPFPAADLGIRFSPVAGFTDYVRGIHMDSGEIFSAWREGDSFTFLLTAEGSAPMPAGTQAGSAEATGAAEPVRSAMVASWLRQ